MAENARVGTDEQLSCKYTIICVYYFIKNDVSNLKGILERYTPRMKKDMYKTVSKKLFDKINIQKKNCLL